ncbi:MULTISPECIES: phosphoenolpyruvate--protein phosphotransferase [unclassified Modicisalibacter]|uniref:phosphoenolpyruvate--protein phosphotransferase n=1 Tax=unclassified Modicisalibacter TaxID=2679913 RepID=UPI001CC9CA51|nr:MULTISPECIES: phosphoenolpyruvate--protein phosphotransferase [unclassified Modicisalibacter]MBZ9560049.1 phosphoenolpyruvate--protein phosphotransferase [Modicisalibacter sp. R2A 31.J]MBZ9575958.1 phosphoenolpyruvate--protein phosphotransferase [Modicisalibacter sp. MOD 31.J]
MVTLVAITAPVDGVIVPLGEVPDPVFAEATLGDGVAIDPLGDTLCTPFDGEVVQCARSAHAVTIRHACGVELLVHLGLDTVHLEGAGIEMLVAVGQRVHEGEPLLRFEPDRLAREAMSLITPLIVVEPGGWRIDSRRGDRGERVRRGDTLLILEVAAQAATGPSRDTGPARERDVTLALESGLHARPAARLRAIAAEHAVELDVLAGERSADTRSLSSLMNLGLVNGDRVRLIARGENAEAALVAAGQLLESPEGGSHGGDVSRPLAQAGAGQWAGRVASPGLAVGPVVRYAPPLPEVPADGAGAAAETAALRDALAAVRVDLEDGMTRAERERHSSEAEILTAHLAWLDDPALAEAAERYIAAGRSAGQAWREALDDEAERLRATGNELLAGRVNDLRDLQRRVMACFGTPPVGPDIPEGAIVLADDLTPSQLIALAAARPAGLCLAAGGTTSHVAILARARNLPCLVALGPTLHEAAGEPVEAAILDAEHGLFEPRPSRERLTAVRERVEARRRRQESERETAHARAVTRDGRSIEVCANVAGAEEAELAAGEGADGIGLLRSEFLFLERDSAPDEEEQRREYQAALDALNGKPVIVRTLDIGADKQLPYLSLPAAPNPALGVRGIRLWRSQPELLDTQLRALVGVEPLDALRIMLPMVSDADEVRAVRRRLNELASELGLSATPSLGVMVEVPSAALCAASLAAEADFLSIGTNDLTQYTLAMDREDPDLAEQLDVLHPAVLRLIQATVKGAAGRCPVGVCGAAASDPLALTVLVALGIDELSVEPARVPAVKAALRELDAGALAEVLPDWLALDDGGAVRERLTAWLEARAAA